MIALALATALLSPQQAQPEWRQVPNPGDIVVEVDVASIHDKDGLRIADSRRSSPGSPVSVIMTFAIDCKAKTVGLDGESHFYRDGKLERSMPIPDSARVQQRSEVLGEVIAMVCAQ